jgi:adenine specific DNA methylase Mod
LVELIWEGKYDADHKRVAPLRIALPFQDVETVNESAQQRQTQFDLFATGRDKEWRNRLIWGDKKYVLPSLLPEFAGKVDLVYIDPPFDTGADFSYTAQVPDNPETDEDETASFTKQPNMLEVKAYRDTWGKGADSFVKWMYETLTLLRELMCDGAAIVVHIGWTRSHHVKLVADEVFGADAFINQIVWKRQSAHSDIGQGAKHLGPVHDVMLLYATASDGPRTWNMQYEPYDESYMDSFYKHVEEGSGRRFGLGDMTGPGGAAKGSPVYEILGVKRAWRFSEENARRLLSEGRIVQTRPGTVPRYKRYADEMPGRPIQDMWMDISWTQNPTYATEKPERLLDRVINLTTNTGDLVLDCFAGSGTTAAVAERRGRRWISADLGRFAIHTTRKRLLGIPGVKPFVVQNLGKYERQAWQAAEFGEEYESRQLAYRQFILDLYRAEPTSSSRWIHGRKGNRWVHVGAVDSPISPGDVTAIANDLKQLAEGGDRVDVLGWDFAFDLNETAKQQAARAGLDFRFLVIPREVLEKKAVEQGDIQFFELGALGVEVAAGSVRGPAATEGRDSGRRVTVTLTDLIVRQDDIPEEVRGHITHWSQMLDYWAVDWDYRDDTFHNQWQSYRTRKDPKIELSASHEYEEAGTYRVMVKAIDILGNDTTKVVEVAVTPRVGILPLPARALTPDPLSRVRRERGS